MESAPRQPVEPGRHIGICAAEGLVWRHRMGNNTATALKVPSPQAAATLACRSGGSA
jgi:hypothetical protein